MGAAERDGTGSGGELASNAASESSPSAAADDGPAFGQRLDDGERELQRAAAARGAMAAAQAVEMEAENAELGARLRSRDEEILRLQSRLAAMVGEAPPPSAEERARAAERRAEATAAEAAEAAQRLAIDDEGGRPWGWGYGRALRRDQAGALKLSRGRGGDRFYRQEMERVSSTPEGLCLPAAWFHSLTLERPDACGVADPGVGGASTGCPRGDGGGQNGRGYIPAAREQPQCDERRASPHGAGRAETASAAADTGAKGRGPRRW
jgi:hypothetical protein